MNNDQEDLTAKIMLWCKADNKPENIEILLKRRLELLYERAYAEGQLSVLERK